MKTFTKIIATGLFATSTFGIILENSIAQNSYDPTYWADKAFQITGGNQKAYDWVMQQHQVELRESRYNAILDAIKNAKKKSTLSQTSCGPTYWADEAFQIMGGSQQAYDAVMELPLEQRKHAYDLLKQWNTVNVFGPTFFADEAFQIMGGSQQAYDAMMELPLEQREHYYGLLKQWSTVNVFGPTFFADEAFQIMGGSQQAYDAMMELPLEQREHYYNLLKYWNTVNVFGPTFFADEAFQITGGKQSAYDSVMEQPVEMREVRYNQIKAKQSIFAQNTVFGF